MNNISPGLDRALLEELKQHFNIERDYNMADREKRKDDKKDMKKKKKDKK